MTLKDLLKKKDKVQAETSAPPITTTGKEESRLEVPGQTPEFTFLRTTTNTQEVIAPPVYPGDLSVPRQSAPSKRLSIFGKHAKHAKPAGDAVEHKTREADAPAKGYPGDLPESQQSPPNKRQSLFRKHSNAVDDETPELKTLEVRPKTERRLSDRLHLGGRSRSASSTNIPADLPEQQGGVAKGEEEEAQWEKRATILAKSNPNSIRQTGSDVSLSDATGDVCPSLSRYIRQ